MLTWGTYGAGSRPQKTGLRKLLAPESGPGLLPIVTPQIRFPRRSKSPLWPPVPGRTIRRRGNSGNLANFGLRGIPRNPRQIMRGGGIGPLVGRFPTPGNRAARAVSPREQARFAANRDPPNLTPAAPAIVMLATRSGPQDPTSREFWKSGECRHLRDSQKSPGNHEGRGYRCENCAYSPKTVSEVHGP